MEKVPARRDPAYIEARLRLSTMFSAQVTVRRDIFRPFFTAILEGKKLLLYQNPLKMHLK